MKSIILFSSIVLSLFLLAGCSKKDENPLDPLNGGNGNFKAEGVVTLNGGPYNNISVNAVGGYGFNIPQNNTSYLTYWGQNQNDSVVINILFAGNQAGTFAWDSEDSGILIIEGQGNSAKILWSEENGTTTITKYGAVNDVVAGTFSGYVYNDENTDSVLVSGSFSIPRVADQSLED
jgi:hypothetical protein